MPVAEHEVHPRFHPKENLAQDTKVVHVVAVDGHISGASRDDMEAA
jgi:hypothetical protein